MKRLITFIFLLTLPSAFSDWTKIASTDFKLAPPPKENSARFKRDFVLLHKYQQERSKQQCELAKRQRYPTYEAFFETSELLTKEQYDATKPFMKKVVNFSVRVANYFKNHTVRDRPYNVDADIKPCIQKLSGKKSYPSSHAVAAIVSSCVLAEIFPNKTTQLEEYGYSLGVLRAVVGVHHPSDVSAGQKLAMDICNRLKSEEDFMKELNKTRP